MSDSSEIAFLSAHELASAIGAGRLTAESVAEVFLHRIQRFPRLHAFTEVYTADVIAAAKAADFSIQSGHQVGQLQGVPVAVKDIVDIEGRITTGGSLLWVNRVSPQTATLVRHMIAAGMIILGKTHTVEFAMGSFGTNQHRGTPWNPWDPECHRIPGGSSAGSAVSVAAGLAPWAIGTDTGGSVRIPAALCGLVGLKTTVGRISCEGVLPLSTTLDTPGPICRTVYDAAILYDVLCGRNSDLQQAGNGQQQRLQAGVAGFRLARVPEKELESVEPAVLEAYNASLELLHKLGATLVDISLPHSFTELGEFVGRIIGAEGYSFVGHLVDDESLPVDDDVRPRIQIGRDMSAQDYLAVLRDQRAAQRAFHTAMDEVDALLTPTTKTTAPLVDSVDQSGTMAHFTRPVNLVGGCALAVPNGFTAGGLPTSLQIACCGGDEEIALRIGAALEQATDWHNSRPPEFDESIEQRLE